jgi:hypothetical protein
LNYARRQQYRRLSRASRAAAGSVVAALLALVVARVGAPPLAGLLLLTALIEKFIDRGELIVAGACYSLPNAIAFDSCRDR